MTNKGHQYLVATTSKNAGPSPSQLRSVKNPPSRIKQSVTEDGIVTAILKHCKASKDQHAAAFGGQD